jgi:lipoprotein-anchoring transpeptidase ErfK/SrfK
MEREHYSREWDEAPMPYSIFFTEHGHAIHGTRSTGALGSPVSHGCVRLAPDNAAVLFSLVQAHGLADTEVEIVGGGFAGGPYAPPSVVGGRPSPLDFDRFIRLLDGG